MLILGIDPGIAITGYGLLEKNNNKIEILTSGAIKTAKDKELADRLVELYSDMQTIVKQYSPEAAAIEKLFYFKNLKTIIPVAQARGVVLTVLAQNKVPIFEYTPLEVKQIMTGYGRATKDEVKKMTEIFLNTTLPKLDDVDDAIAIAAAHCIANGLIKK